MKKLPKNWTTADIMGLYGSAGSYKGETMATNAMGKWINAGGMWAWTPYIAGGDDPSMPPPQVGQMYTEGPPYHGGVTPPGGTFKTWVVPSPTGKTLQTIVNWASGPVAANPYADWYKKQGK